MALILFLPLVVSIFSFIIPKKMVKEMGLAFSGTFVVYVLYLMLFQFDPAQDFDIKFERLGIEKMGALFSFGLDGVGILLILLTNLVVFYVNIITLPKEYDAKFYGLLFLMQFALIGVFSSLNAFFFYVFWELALIPIYIILLLYGRGEDLKQTFVRFFVFTFVGSLMLLAGIILFHSELNMGFFNGFQYTRWIVEQLEGNKSLAFMILMLIGFGVKIPIFPLHSWQANTYRKAPIEGTILLSAIMLKMGLYGLLRWLVPFLDIHQPIVQNVAIVLSVAGVIYGAIIALRRNDLKMIAAFSSLSHVGLIAAGILTTNVYGLQGGIIQMIVHGINILGLFYAINIIERNTGTRNIQDLGGIALKAPKFAILSLIIILGTISVPLTNGFPGEMMLLLSLYLYHPILGILAGFTIIFGAAYMLRIYQLSFFRECSPETEDFKDIAGGELLALGFIAFLVIAIGVYPQGILQISEIAVNHLKNLIATRLM